MGFRSAGFVHSVSSLGMKRSGSCCAAVPAVEFWQRGGRRHDVLQVAREAVHPFSLFRMILPPPVYILIR